MAASMVRHACFVSQMNTAADICCIVKSCANIHVRRYARMLRRFPLKMLTQKEAENLAKGDAHKLKVEPAKAYQQLHGDKDQRYADELRIPFTKLHEGDERFGQVVAAAKSRLMREKKGLILLEGYRLISDAIDAGVHVKALYFSKVEILQRIPWQQAQCDIYKVQQRQMKLWSDVVTPSGVMAVCQMPKEGELTCEVDPLPITLVCDNVRDPGNMGTLLRSAAAVGCQKVLITKGCVDIWEPKVLRAGAGAQFRLHLLNNLRWELIGNYLSHDSHVYLADNAAASDSSTPVPSQHVMEQIASVDPGTVYTELDEETNKTYQIDPSYLDTATVKLFSKAPLPRHCYTDVDYAHGGEVVIVVGGETEGLSSPSHKLAFERNGDRINIPMMVGVESLNSAVAASIILFEVKRQMARSYTERTDEKPHRQYSS